MSTKRANFKSGDILRGHNRNDIVIVLRASGHNSVLVRQIKDYGSPAFPVGAIYTMDSDYFTKPNFSEEQLAEIKAGAL